MSRKGAPHSILSSGGVPPQGTEPRIEGCGSVGRTLRHGLRPTQDAVWLEFALSNPSTDEVCFMNQHLLTHWRPSARAASVQRPLPRDRCVQQAGPFARIRVLWRQIETRDAGLDQEVVLGVTGDELALVVDDQLLRLIIEGRALSRIQLDITFVDQLVDFW